MTDSSHEKNAGLWSRLDKIVLGGLWAAGLSWAVWVFYSPRIKLQGEWRTVRVTAQGNFEILKELDASRLVPIPLTRPDPGAVTIGKPTLAPAEPVGGLASRVVTILALALPEGTEIRFEPLRGSNLDIYLPAQNFQSVPYPDRDELTKAVGKAWCHGTGPHSHYFLPSVRVRDIRTGETLGRYNCVLHW